MIVDSAVPQEQNKNILNMVIPMYIRMYSHTCVCIYINMYGGNFSTLIFNASSHLDSEE